MMLPITASLILSTCGGGGGGGGFFLPSGPSGGGTPGAVYPRFAYVANSNDGSISMYTVNPDTGQLRHNGYVLAGTNPHSVAAHPTGKFVFVTNYGSASVSAYKVETNGRLTPVAGSPFTGGPKPRGLVVHPNGQYLYVVNSGTVGALSNSVSVYSIDPATGALGFVVAQATGTSPFSVTVHPAGKIIYVANFTDSTISAFRIEANGLLTAIDIDAATGGTQLSITAGVQPHSVTLDPTGTFAYVANWLSNDVSAFSVNAQGALTKISCGGGTGCSNSFPDNFPAGLNPRMMTVHPNGKFAYVANHLGNTISAYSISRTTGALTRIDADGDYTNGIQDFASGVKPGGVTIDPSGKFLYAANLDDNTMSIYRIDSATGMLTALPAIAGRAGNVEMAMTGGTAPVKFTPKFAYVANESSNDVSIFTIVSSSGALKSVSGSPFSTLPRPMAVAVDPTGRFAYISTFGNTVKVSNQISAFNIDPATGAFTTALPGSPFTTGLNPAAVAVDPSGHFVYVANYNSQSVSMFSINAADGSLTSIGADVATGGYQSRSIVVDPTGRFVYVTNALSNTVSALSIGSGGALTRLDADPGTPGEQNFSVGAYPYFIAVSPTGRFLYVANRNGTTVSVLSVDTVTGMLTRLDLDPATPGYQETTTGFGPASIAVDPHGKFAYVVNDNDSTVSAYSIDATSGFLNAIGNPTAVGGLALSVSVDVSGRFVYATGGTAVLAYSIEPMGTLMALMGGPYPVGTFPKYITTNGTIE